MADKSEIYVPTNLTEMIKIMDNKVDKVDIAVYMIENDGLF